MNEDLLQYIWQYKYLLKHKLFTTRDEPLQIIHPGHINRDAGPDFFNARLVVDGTLWAGNIEVHIKSSDWKKHGHQTDPSYDNVILHVVLEHDEPVYNRYNKEIPTLELRHLLPVSLVRKYHQLKQSKNTLPCEKIFEWPEPVITTNWLDRLSVERLEEKCNYVFALLKESNNHWEQVFYQLLARYYGQKINELPFELLARQLPYKVLARNRHQLLQTQALVLGVSGLLQKQFDDDYLRLLRREFKTLQLKYELPVIDKSLWKFARTRPANFPTVRLLQFAQLLHRTDKLFSDLLKAITLTEARALFEVHSDQLICAGAMQGKTKNQKLTGIQTGESFINTLLINVAVPALFSYGRWVQDEALCNRALSWLELLKPEKNSIISLWEKMGFKAAHAKQTQALITLNNYYCRQQQCLRCAFGNHILNKTSS